MQKKNLSVAERTEYHRLEQVIGCKWSVGVIAAIGEGVTRPGAIQRFIPGISKKVLSERLRRLTNFGIIAFEKRSDTLPSTEYHLTELGRKLAQILALLDKLNIGTSEVIPRLPRRSEE